MMKVLVWRTRLNRELIAGLSIPVAIMKISFSAKRGWRSLYGDFERPGKVAGTTTVVLQVVGQGNAGSRRGIVGPAKRFMITEHLNRRAGTRLHCGQIQGAARPHCGHGIHDALVFRARIANRCSFAPERTFSFPRSINGFGIDFEPAAHGTQLLFGFRVELPIPVRSDAHHEVPAFGDYIHKISHDPARSLILRGVWLKGKRSAERIDNKPRDVGILLASRHEAFGSIVVTVVADAASTKHHIGLDCPQV